MSPDAGGADPGPDDVDAQFAEIVAGYHEDVVDRPPVPPIELTDLSEFTGLTPRTPTPQEPGLLDGLDTFGSDLPEDDEHYVPPPPPPIPRPLRRTVGALLCLVAGITLLFWPSLLPIDTNVGMAIGFIGIMGGTVILIRGLRSGDDDDPGDDGARV